MKNKDLTSLRGKKKNELLDLIEKKRKDLIESHAKVKSGQEKDLKKVKNLKKDIAQILTLVTESNFEKEEEKKEEKTK